MRETTDEHLTEQADVLVPPPQLHIVPRALTPRARRRSWNELPVRIWVILAVAVTFITAYFTVSTYLGGRYGRWLITNGVPVSAELHRVQGTLDRRQVFRRSDRLQVELNYDVPGHPRVMYAEGALTPLRDQVPVQQVRVGDRVPVRVDPNRPRVWTDLTEPLPWLAEFTIVLFLLPLLALLAAVALWRRWQVLGVWRKGTVAPAVVVAQKHTAVAPRSRLLRFTLADGTDRRVWSTLVPARLAPAPGESMWVIFPPGNPARAIVADLYL